MMIINKTYDKSLWLMLCSDRVNREKIINFLNIIPIEFYNKLRVSLGFYISDKMTFSINQDDEFYNSFLSGEIKTSGDMRYWYIIEPKTGALSFGESIVTEECEYELFHMVLYPIDEKILNDSISYNDCLIGQTTNGYLDDYSLNKVSDTTDFHLIRFSFCDIVVSTCKSSIYNKNKYRLVDLDKMPNKYILNDLRNKDSVKKLIRGKKNSG